MIPFTYEQAVLLREGQRQVAAILLGASARFFRAIGRGLAKSWDGEAILRGFPI